MRFSYLGLEKILDYRKMGFKKLNTQLKTLLTSTIATLLLLFAPACARAAQGSLFFYYLGSDDLVLKRLLLDPHSFRTEQLDLAQTAVIQERLPTVGTELIRLRARVEQGMGMLIVLGEKTSAASLVYITDGVLRPRTLVGAGPGSNRPQQLEKIAALIQYVGARSEPLATQINWRSAGPVYERTVLTLADTTRAQVLVATARTDPVLPRTPILVKLRLKRGLIYVLTTWLKPAIQTQHPVSLFELLRLGETGENYELQRWAYFNWLLYFLSRNAAGAEAAPFARWIASPVPKKVDVYLLAAITGSTCVVLALTFLFIRRLSMAHPEKLSKIRVFSVNPSETRRNGQSISRVGQKDYLHESGEPKKFKESLDASKWELIGFHRPLSGFFYNYLFALLVMIPFNVATTFFLERTFFNPFVESRGAVATVNQFMPFFFAILDLGTGQAMVKYFAEFRVRNPERAIQYGQFFVWFHALMGSLAVAALALTGAIVLPRTSVAFLAWLVVFNAYTLFPGFSSIFFNFFRAVQRFDYSQFLIVLTYVLLPIPVMACSLVGRKWGLMHESYGEGLGAALGSAVGGIIGNLLIAALGAIFYRTVGFKLSTLFMAHFDLDTVVRSLRYGLKLTIGSLATALSWAVVPLLMVSILPDFLELNEFWLICYMLTFAYIETGAYIFTVLMPSISESYSHRMLLLTRHYLDQGLRWALMVTTMLGVAFVVCSPVIIFGLLPPQFSPVVQVLVLAHLWRAVDFAGRLPDQVFQAVGRTEFFTLCAVVEHSSRIGFAYILMKKFGFPGVFYAFAASSSLKAIVGWWLMASKVLPPKFSFYQTLINPISSAVTTYFALTGISKLIPSGIGHVFGSWLVVAICLFGSLPAYMFVSGFYGWDEQSLAEFRDACEIVPKPFQALAKVAFRMACVGTSISPWHGRFPTACGSAALTEAEELTRIKLPLN